MSVDRALAEIFPLLLEKGMASHAEEVRGIRWGGRRVVDYIYIERERGLRETASERNLCRSVVDTMSRCEEILG